MEFPREENQAAFRISLASFTELGLMLQLFDALLLRCRAARALSGIDSAWSTHLRSVSGPTPTLGPNA